jgi:hypothetical protein
VGVDWREAGVAAPDELGCLRSSWTGPRDAEGETLFGEDVGLSSVVWSCSVTEGSVVILERTSMSSLAVTETSSCSYKLVRRKHGIIQSRESRRKKRKEGYA